MQGKFINIKTYDFTDQATGEHISGQNMNCLVKDEIVKVKLTNEELKHLVDSKVSFGMNVDLDVEVKGKYANYTLANHAK